jgi:hypothetical protein
MPVCTNCGKAVGGDMNVHKSGKACKKKKAALVKIVAEQNTNKWRIVSTNAETVPGERIHALEAWFWDGCPMRATEMWHVLASGTSIKLLEEIAKEEGLLMTYKV